MQIKGIERVNEYTDPELLKESEVTTLTNMVIEGNKAKKRGAIVSYNETSAGGQIVDLIELNDSLLGLVDIGSSRSLKISSGGSWTSLRDSMDDTSLQGLQYKDRAYLTNGVAAPFVTDGTTYWDLALPTPNLTNVVTASVSGGNLDATQSIYRYAICYINDRGEISNFSIIGHRMNGSAYSVDGTYKTINFNGLPVSTRTDVTGRRIFRTEGNGEIFYWLTDIDNVATTFSDSSADTSLDLSVTLSYTNVPTKASSIALHKDRMFLANVTSQKINAVVKPPKIDMGLSCTQTDGQYRYYAITYTDSLGNESVLSAYDRVRVGEGNVWTTTLAYVPKAWVGASTRDLNVVKINIYRSTNASTFYKIKEITSTHTDWSTALPYLSTTDANLANGTVYASVGSEIYPSRVYYSDIDKFGQVSELNYIDVYTQDNETIIGIVDQADGVLVFKEKSICMIYTSGSPYNWRVVKLIENIGCSNVKSIQRAKNSIYFQYNQDFYRYPDMQLVSQTYQNTLEDITVTDTAYVSKYNWYVLVTDNHLHVYDERIDGWYDFEISNAYMTSAIETIDKNFFIGLNSGETLRYDEDEDLDYNTGTDSNEDPIICVLKSKHFITSNPTQLFRLRKLFMSLKKGVDALNLTLRNPETNETISKGISGAGYINSRLITDSFAGTLKETNKLKFELAGDIEEFNSMEIEGRLRNRNRIWS